LTEQSAKQFLANVAAAFARKPFRPHRLFTSGHAQTIVSYLWPRRRSLKVEDEQRLFQVDSDVRLLAHCRWQKNPTKHPTIVLWHGMEGSTSSLYMLAIAKKVFATGFNVVRVNMRNCGGTEHLSPTLYHGGLSGDLRAVVEELISVDGLRRLCLIGYSLGGNLVLKLAGEYGNNPPPEVLGICAVSPSIDLASSADAICRRSNWIYHQDFLRRMRNRIYLKKRFFPELYDVSNLKSIRTIRAFDDRFTARAAGFNGADDYYYKSSSIRSIAQIRIPALIIHAEDDPFIPFAPLQNRDISENTFILLIATKRGGHVAFVGAGLDGEDRFWAENRAVDFCVMACAQT
jgi:predicted alpha/beta-fold hydrolase